MKWLSITTDKPKHICQLNIYQSIHVPWSEIHRNCSWLLNINESLIVPLRLFNFITFYWVLNLLNYKNLLLVSSKVVEIQFLMLIILLQSQWKKTFWRWHFVRPEKLMFHFFEAFEVEWRNLDHSMGKFWWEPSDDIFTVIPANFVMVFFRLLICCYFWWEMEKAVHSLLVHHFICPQWSPQHFQLLE